MGLSRLLPPAEAAYRGSRLSYWFLVLVAVAGTARSLVHVLAPDGGAGSIAGLDTGVEGGANLVAMFGQWGASQKDKSGLRAR